MSVQIQFGDITKYSTDAIVNAANSRLRAGGGVCGAIFEAAGYEQLTEACTRIGHCPTGQAVITPGFHLPAKYIIHTAGPIWHGGNENEPQLLCQCYIRSIQLAAEHGCKSIAFPLISAGIYGYPIADAMRIALHACSTALLQYDMEVILVLFHYTIQAACAAQLDDVEDYIRTHHAADVLHAPFSYLNEVLEEQKQDSFSTRVLRYIDENGLSDTWVYKRANLDRRVFSSLRRNPDYQPSRQTAIALALALELPEAEIHTLLASAGYALSHSNRADLIVEYYIQNGIYDISEINQALFAFGENLLGN